MALQLFKIADVTVATPQANIEFTSIPSGYTDLMLVSSSTSNRNDDTGENIRVQLNGTTTGYSTRRIYGSGSTTASDTDTGASWNWGTTGNIFNGNNIFGNAILYIPNYTSSNNKSASSDGVGERNATTVYMAINAHLWSNTAAITSIKLTPQVGSTWQANSTFTLYGVL